MAHVPPQPVVATRPAVSAPAKEGEATRDAAQDQKVALNGRRRGSRALPATSTREPGELVCLDTSKGGQGVADHGVRCSLLYGVAWMRHAPNSGCATRARNPHAWTNGFVERLQGNSISSLDTLGQDLEPRGHLRGHCPLSPDFAMVRRV
jgi:hypothetical protein